MANYNCSACEDIRSIDPNLIVNGFTDSECASLQNDTGIVPSSGHNDCTDLNNMNDCLVGNMEEEVNLYEVCDWKPFMKRFIDNLWTELKAIICAICGIWTNVHNIWDKINQILKDIEKLYCITSYMGKGATFSIGEEPTDGSYIVAGKGCSFLGPKGSDDHASDLHLRYIAGGFATLACSIDFHQDNFTDEGYCYNFDNNGRNPQNTKSRSGNSVWGETGRPASGGELAYEIRIKKSQYPQLRSLYTGRGQMSLGGVFLSSALVFNEGSWAYGQHGSCHSNKSSTPGEPDRDGYSRGHQVPEGWIYVQCRIDWLERPLANGGQYSPYNWMGIRINQEEIDC